MDIMEAMKSYNAIESPVGEILPEQRGLYCIKVMRTFLLSENCLQTMHIVC